MQDRLIVEQNLCAHKGEEFALAMYTMSDISQNEVTTVHIYSIQIWDTKFQGAYQILS